MDLGLSAKRAVVSGGSLGIGKAIARELAREGVGVAAEIACLTVFLASDTARAVTGELVVATGGAGRGESS